MAATAGPAHVDLTEPHPPSLSPRGMAIAGWVSFVVAGWIFITLAWNVASAASLVLFDARASAWLHLHRSPALTTSLYAITQANSTLGIGVMSLVLGFALARMREWYWMLSVALSVGGGLALNLLLKQAYARARPHFDDPILTLTSYSFPSGHTAGATVFYGVLAAFLVSRTYPPSRRVAIVACAVLAVVLVGFSRVYLGAHFVSDVTAAAASSAAWLALCLSVVHQLVRSRRA
jgi:undecaprenyl-diphosphatase